MDCASPIARVHSWPTGWGSPHRMRARGQGVAAGEEGGVAEVVVLVLVGLVSGCADDGGGFEVVVVDAVDDGGLDVEERVLEVDDDGGLEVDDVEVVDDGGSDVVDVELDELEVDELLLDDCVVEVVDDGARDERGLVADFVADFDDEGALEGEVLVPPAGESPDPERMIARTMPAMMTTRASTPAVINTPLRRRPSSRGSSVAPLTGRGATGGIGGPGRTGGVAAAGTEPIIWVAALASPPPAAGINAVVSFAFVRSARAT